MLAGDVPGQPPEGSAECAWRAWSRRHPAAAASRRGARSGGGENRGGGSSVGILTVEILPVEIPVVVIAKVILEDAVADQVGAALEVDLAGEHILVATDELVGLEQFGAGRQQVDAVDGIAGGHVLDVIDGFEKT